MSPRRLPPKRPWFVRALKLRHLDCIDPIEHTYREVARSPEEARERVRSLMLVVQVLDVRPADEGRA